jgi:hypothetical protein
MTRSLGDQLPDSLRQLLDGSDLASREGLTFLLLTTDDAGWPHLAMLSVGEVVAMDDRTLRAGLWLHSSTSKNLTRAGRAMLTLCEQSGFKALINACKEHRYLPVFSKRTALRREMYDQVASRWSSLGLAGQAPSVRAYESDQPLIYHEQGSFEPGAANRAKDAPPAPSM